MTMPDERMNYESMTKMANEFKAAQDQLQQTLSSMTNASKMMGDGALLGSGGDTFREAIDQKLKKKLTKMIEKMKELEGDINKAVDENKKAVETGKKGF
jgi:WXG100 family type VII secretion target